MKKLLSAALLCVIILSASSCGRGGVLPPGNAANYGYLLVDGSYIFFTKVIMTDFGYHSNIYRFDTRNPRAEPLLIARMESDFHNEMNAFMTMHGGYLYFLPYFLHESIKEASPNIYRVRPNGADVVPEALLEQDASITFMHIDGGRIYFYDEGAGYEGRLYSIRPDGRDRRIVAEAIMDSISISGGTAYFTDHELLRSVSLRGGAIRDIFDFSELEEPIVPHMIIADGNYIYYADDFGSLVGRIRTNGRDNRVIYAADETSLEYIVSFNVSGDSVFIVLGGYGTEQSYAIISVPRSGGDPRVIVSDAEHLGDIFPVAVWGATIYFKGMLIYETRLDTQCGYVWFHVSAHGGRLEYWQPFSVFDADFDDWDYDGWWYEYDWDD